MILTFFNVDVGVEKYWDSSFLHLGVFCFYGIFNPKKIFQKGQKFESHFFQLLKGISRYYYMG